MDILHWPKLVSAICSHCDSQLAIEMTQISVYNEKSRHIYRKHNIVKHFLSN